MYYYFILVLFDYELLRDNDKWDNKPCIGYLIIGLLYNLIIIGI